MQKQKMIRTVIMILLIILPLAMVLYFTIARYNSEQVLFTMADPKGDDYGPGTYKYPWASIFDPKKEHLDLVKFTVLSVRDQYCFDLVFPRVINPWGAPEGFSHPIVEVYISDDSDGRVEPLRQGTNVQFDSQHPWKYLIKVVSFNKTSLFTAKSSADSEGVTEGVKASLLPDKRTVRVSVPRELLPGEPQNWRYYVLVGSLDGLGPDNFRKVNASASQWNFGGGTDTDYDPNVIDMLASRGKQEDMLASYSVEGKSLAVIVPVEGQPIKLNLWEKFLQGLINIFYL